MPHLATRRAVAAACLALAAAGAFAQAMYRWVDEKGVTHFSEHPPPGDAKATKIQPKVTPPSSGAAAPRGGPEDWKAQELEFRKRQVERGKREQAEEREKAEREARCADARKRLAFLEEHGAIYRRKDDGSRVYMSEEARESAIAEQRRAVRESCGSR